jgi:two-component system phosphate regulon sensor histidine kinase PhoR
MGPTSIIALGLLLAGWIGRAFWERRRWKRLDRFLERWSQDGARAGSLEGQLELEREGGQDPWLGQVVQRLERWGRGQGELKRQLEHEVDCLRTILSSLEDGVLVADEHQKIRLVNGAFGRMFGRESDRWAGRSVLEVLGEPEVYRLIQRVIEAGGVESQQVELVPGKRARHVMVRAAAMGGESGRVEVLVVFRDVSRLLELEKVRRDFVANVSHELRTPLAIFQGYLENLLDLPDLPVSERQEILRILERHSQRLNVLVEDLLNLARLEARREEFRWEEVDPLGFIRGVARDWEVRCQGQDLAVVLECEPGLPAVRMDPLRIEQVLHNLLENARKHLPATGARVVLSARLEGEGVRICVEDNGSGIPLPDLPHVFERFYRGSKSRTREGDGAHSSGLGLSIVKHIVLQHGGEVGASSPPGKGAAVWFTLPLGSGAENGRVG